MKLTLVKKKYTVLFMKHYGQACAIARALDVVGERWSLLLVRELTLGPRRYRDLATGLPGIPSNVLAARLKDLQAAGVITRRTLPAPTDVTVYELTDAGRALQPALNELLDWGLRYGPEPSQDDVGPARLGTAWRRGPAGRTARRADLRAPGRAGVLLPRLRRRHAHRPPRAGTGRRRGGHHARRHPLQPPDRPDDRDRRRPARTVDGDTEIARRALEPLAAALTKPAPAM